MFDRNFFVFFILAIATLFLGCAVDRDRIEAKAAAARVHVQMQIGDYSAIYRESATRFKNVGSESQFAAKMKQVHEQNGALKRVDEVAFEMAIDSRVGRTYVLLFNLEYERGHATERLVFARSGSGQMQLWKLDVDPVD